MAQIQQAVRILQQAVAHVDPASDIGQAALDAIKKLSKVAPPIQGAPGVGMEALRNLAMQARQQAPLEAVLRAQTLNPQGGAAPPA